MKFVGDYLAAVYIYPYSVFIVELMVNKQMRWVLSESPVRSAPRPDSPSCHAVRSAAPPTVHFSDREGPWHSVDGVKVILARPCPDTVCCPAFLCCRFSPPSTIKGPGGDACVLPAVAFGRARLPGEIVARTGCTRLQAAGQRHGGPVASAATGSRHATEEGTSCGRGRTASAARERVQKGSLRPAQRQLCVPAAL